MASPGLETVVTEAHRLLEVGWEPGFHRLRETLEFLPPPRHSDNSRFLNLPPVYFVGALQKLRTREFVLFTGLNPNGDERHRGQLEVPFEEYWRWCLGYFSGPDRSQHYELHEAFLQGFFGEAITGDSLLATKAVDVDLCGLASSSGWPEEQVRLLRAARPRIHRPQLHEMRRSSNYPTFGYSARIFELLAPQAACVVARYGGTWSALRELYPSTAEGAIAVGGRDVSLFCIRNDGRNAPSQASAVALGREARRSMEHGDG